MAELPCLDAGRKVRPSSYAQLRRIGFAGGTAGRQNVESRTDRGELDRPAAALRPAGAPPPATTCRSAGPRTGSRPASADEGAK